MRDSWRNKSGHVAFALAAALIPYWGLWTHYFIRDDWDWLERAQSICADPRFLLQARQDAFNYLPLRPMVDLTFALTYAAAGLAPWAHYGVHLAFHALNVWLVTRLALAWGLAGLAPLCAGAVFALWWPSREAVLHLYARPHVLGLTWGLLAAIWHAPRAEGHREGVWPWTLAFLGALLTYEGAVALLVLLPLAERWFTGRIQWRRYRYAAGITALWLLWQIVARVGKPDAWGAWSFGPHMLVQWMLGTAAAYVPIPTHPAWTSLTEAWPVGARASVAAMGWGVAALSIWWVWRTVRRVGAPGRLALAWGAGWVGLASGFAEAFAGRYLYPASAGASMLVSVGIARAWERGSRRARVAVGISVLGLVVLGLFRVSVAQAGRRTAAVRRIVSDLQYLAPGLPDGRITVMVESSDPDLPLHKQRLNRVARMTIGHRWEFDVAEPGRPVEAVAGAAVLSYREGRLSLLRIP